MTWAVLRSRGLRGGAVSCLVALTGCLPAPERTYETVECASDVDCNAAAGEVCDVGVCWGNPPVGEFSAILVPPTALAGDLVMTGVPTLTLASDGWIYDQSGGQLTFDRGVALTGRITVPCPPTLPACTTRQPLPGTIRWSRPSGIPGGPKLTGSAVVGSDGSYALVVTAPRVDAPVTITLAFTPSQTRFGDDLPSPAMLVPPMTRELTITTASIDERTGKIVADLELDPSRLRTVTGVITRPFTAPISGWRLQAEVVVDGGARQLASTIAVTDGAGNFTLRLEPEVEIADVVCAPPLTTEALRDSRPSVRVRDVPVAALTGPIPAIAVPQLGVPVPVTFDVSGTDSSGGDVGVDGATVIVRLDQRLPDSNGRYLELEVQATTTNGYASLPLFPVLDGEALPYTVDVLPGPASELASRYGVPLVVDEAPTPIGLPRRRSLVGTVLDAGDRPVAGATVAASLSTATLCALSTSAARQARSLASTQIATNAKGEFTLFVDDDLAGVALTYDVAVRPASGDTRPQWSFVELVPTSDGARVDLRLPDAASVRGVVLSTDYGPVEGAALSIYEQVEGARSCATTLGATGTALLRGLGTTDPAGTAAIVLPRPAL